MTEETSILLFEFLTVTWIFCIGACFGSFLNVIVYRLPLGLNLSYPPSRCPYCETPILLKDNIPIMGWLLLKGRCRQCSSSISFRYPFIEAFTACLFIYILFIEVASGGANLPLRQLNFYTGIRWTIWQTQWDLLRLYAYHMLFLYTLLASILIEFDRQKIPLKRLVIPTLLIAIFSPGFYPELLPVPAIRYLYEIIPQTLIPLSERTFFVIPAVLTSIIGAISGAVAGTFFLISEPKGNKNQNPTDYPILYILCGAFLGWQAVLSIALLQLILGFLIQVIGGFVSSILKMVPSTIILFIAVILHITFWNKIYSSLF